MHKRWFAIVVSICALAIAPSTAFAGSNDGTAGQEVSQTQSGTNENSTEQSASSEASSNQTNVNAPVTVGSPGSNNGDVNQGNAAYNSASSSNNNETQQDNQQNQGDQTTARTAYLPVEWMSAGDAARPRFCGRRTMATYSTSAVERATSFFICCGSIRRWT